MMKTDGVLPAEKSLLDKVTEAYPVSFAAGQIPQGHITQGLVPLIDAVVALQAQVKALTAQVEAMKGGK